MKFIADVQAASTRRISAKKRVVDRYHTTIMDEKGTVYYAGYLDVFDSKIEMDRIRTMMAYPEEFAEACGKLLRKMSRVNPNDLSDFE